MKKSVASFLGIAVLTIGANSLFAAPANNDWFEQWYRAKYGRSSPTEEARQKAEAAKIAFREEAAPAGTRPANIWFEDWYKAKYGRPSPREEVRLNAEVASTAFREERTATEPANTWLQDWYKAKYGRPYPLESGRR